MEITKNGFKFGGIHFFRTNTDAIALGDFGRKKKPVLSANYLDVVDTLTSADLAKVHIRVGQPVQLDWNMWRNAGLTTGLNYLNGDGVDQTIGNEAEVKAKLVLVKFSIPNGPLKTVINGNATVLDSLKGGSNVRIVCGVWVVMEAALSEKFGSQAKVNAKSDKGLTLQVSVAYAGGSETEIVLTKGATFAYLLTKPKWNKGRVVEFEDDQLGLA